MTTVKIHRRPWRLAGRDVARGVCLGGSLAAGFMRGGLRMLVFGLFASVTIAQADIAGSFIQLHRGKVERTDAEWREDLRHLKGLGGDTVIVQWTAEEPVAYFQPLSEASSIQRGRAPVQLKGITEVFPVLEKIFDAAEAEGVYVVLGLQHHPEYWNQIKGREKVIRDFFRIRMARNEQLQQELLRAFGDRAAWTGYYIPDEIDDFTWRAPSMRVLMREYIHRMTSILKANDPERSVSVSAFFRGRTMPESVVESLLSIVVDSGLDMVLLQDGVGVGDPPLEYIELYYRAITDGWQRADVMHATPLPALWCVLETFEQNSAEGEPFSAHPAPAERLQEQVRRARPYFDHIILFTLDDYIHPDHGEAERMAYEALRSDPASN